MNPKLTGKSKLKLEISEGIQFHLIGISSHENDYRLVWAVNHTLNFHFIRSENLTVPDPKLETDLEFSRYIFEDEDRYLKFFLIANRCPDGILFPEIKNFDFIIQVIGEANEKLVGEIVKVLRKVEIISAAFIINPSSLKGIKKLMAY